MRLLFTVNNNTIYMYIIRIYHLFLQVICLQNHPRPRLAFVISNTILLQDFPSISLPRFPTLFVVFRQIFSPSDYFLKLYKIVSFKFFKRVLSVIISLFILWFLQYHHVYSSFSFFRSLHSLVSVSIPLNYTFSRLYSRHKCDTKHTVSNKKHII